MSRSIIHLVGSKSRKDPLKFGADPAARFDGEINRLASTQLFKIVGFVDSVKAGDHDAVHDMRVATRRMRALIKIRLANDESKQWKKSGKFLRDLGRALGAVRGEDVLIRGLDAHCADRPALRTVGIAWRIRRAPRLTQLKALLESEAFESWATKKRELVETLERDSTTVAETARAACEPLLQELQSLLPISADTTMESLHELRIEAKRFRYAIEFYARALPGDSRMLLTNLIKLQDLIGQIHDDDLRKMELEVAIDSVQNWTDDELRQLLTERDCIAESIARARRKLPRATHFLRDLAFASD